MCVLIYRILFCVGGGGDGDGDGDGGVLNAIVTAAVTDERALA